MWKVLLKVYLSLSRKVGSSTHLFFYETHVTEKLFRTYVHNFIRLDEKCTKYVKKLYQRPEVTRGFHCTDFYNTFIRWRYVENL